MKTLSIEDELADLNHKTRLILRRYALELLEVSLGIDRTNRRQLSKKDRKAHGLYGER